MVHAERTAGYQLGTRLARLHAQDIVRVQLSGNTRLRLAWDATPAALADLQKLAAADECASYPAPRACCPLSVIPNQALLS